MVIIINLPFSDILKKRRLLHGTYDLFYSSVLLHLISLILIMKAKLDYSVDGISDDKHMMEITGENNSNNNIS